MTATVMISKGRPEDAVPILRAALQEGMQPEHEGNIRRLLGDALGECQRYAEARTELTLASEILDEVNDQRNTVETLGGLAIIEMEEGRSDVANEIYRRAIDISNDIGFRYGVAVNSLNLGNSLQLGGKIGPALEAYERAIAGFLMLENERGRAFVNSNLASLRHHLLGDDTRAADAANQALTFYEASSDPRGQAQCLEVLADIARRSGAHDESQRLLDAGHRCLDHTDDAWLTIQLSVTEAKLELDQGNVSEALVILARSEALCSDSGANDLAGAIAAANARAYFEVGDIEQLLELPEIDNPVDEMQISHWKWQAARSAGEPEVAYGHLERSAMLLEEWTATLSLVDRELAMRATPEVVAIVSEWRVARPHVVHVHLPGIMAPRGRAVRSDELVEVAWTVQHATDAVVVSPQDRRRQVVTRLLAEAEDQMAAPGIADIATILGVSEATIRRDLAALRAGGRTVTTRGGRQVGPTQSSPE